VTPLEEPGLRIMVATRPVDFRRGHDGLAAYAQIALGFAPANGLVLIFRARRGDRLKILYWDGNGIIMSYKRMETGNFVWPRPGDAVMALTKLQFQALFAGLDWRRIEVPKTCLPRAAE
jgi:transposase